MYDASVCYFKDENSHVKEIKRENIESKYRFNYMHLNCLKTPKCICDKEVNIYFIKNS